MPHLLVAFPLHRWRVLAAACLAALAGEGVIAATVAAMSARIGDARSAWETGIISHTNARAQAAGIAPGDDLPTFADKAIAASKDG